MKALTVRHPWSWAIVHGGKTIENRTRNVAGKYRGPLAIHTSQTLDGDALYDPTIMAAYAATVGDAHMIITVLLILLGAAVLVPLLQRDLTRAAGADLIEPRERCFVAVVDGTTVAYRADEPLDETGQRALEALVRAAVHHVQVTDPDLEERQAAARERNRARLIRLGLITPDQEDR